MCEYSGSRSIAATPENSEKEERLCVSVLRALCVLAHIKDNRTDDDQALDDVGHVIIDLQHNQAVIDNAEDQDACQNTGYAADTAGVGGAAYGSRSDSVQLVVQAGVGRVSRTCTACQQDTCNSRTNRAPYINHDEVLFYIDASNAGSLIVAADGIHVFAEAGLRQQEGRDRKHNEEYQNDDRNRF